MNALISFTLSFSLLILLGCSHDPQQKVAELNKEKTKTLTIDLQPFSDIPDAYVKYVYNELIKIYPNIKVKKEIPLPPSAYYHKRGRYKADTIINYLRNQTIEGHVTMGLTSKDISHAKGNISDYGLMGLAYQPGKSGVVSYFRPSRKNRREQFFKLTIH